MNTSMLTNIVLHAHEISYIWPKSVKRQIEKLKEKVIEEPKMDRVDLRNLPLITIDNEDAHDLDDAVYCEKKCDGGWQLWVAIADVSYYVRPYTPLDREACNRGTSIYFPSQVVPMLPKILSNGLCSLNPMVDRLCMICEMTISSKGHLTNYKFYEAVMSSHARLTYNKVWHIIQGNKALNNKYAMLVKNIEELYNLYKTLVLAREKRGSISFDSEEIKFIFNAEKRIERIEQTQRNDVHRLIEECMILTNISAAYFIERAKEPALFRIHDKPSIESIIKLRSILAELGLKLPGGKKPKPQDYNALLESIVNRSDYDILQSILLRSFKQAIYNPENRGHFGLSLHSYAHFTSPIRRYPDILLHRSIKYLLALENDNISKGKYTITGGWHYSIEEMFQMGKHCSMTERRADEATREVIDWLKCDLMLNHIGKVFKGTISSIANFGFFVRLDKLFIDGLVHISRINKSYCHFDRISQRLTDSSGRIYKLGDRVKVKVETVSKKDRKIDLSLISIEKYLHNRVRKV